MKKANSNPKAAEHLKNEYLQHIKPLLKRAPWQLRITVHKGKPLPVLLIKERFTADGEAKNGGSHPGKALLKDRGLIYGPSLRRCMPIIRLIIGRVCDPSGIPLELQYFFPNGRSSFLGNLPLNEEAGAKLALIFRLQGRMADLDRVELMAWRVDRFSREEAIYWLSRATQYGPAANRWAQAGMRILLGGQPGDRAIGPALERLRR